MEHTAQYATESRPQPGDFKDLQRLRQACRVAFERYVDTISEGSGELVRVRPGSVDQLARVNLAILERREQVALDNYTRAKANLMKFLTGEYVSNAAGAK